MRLPATPTVTLMRELVSALPRRRLAGRSIVAVDGADGAGKTVFADTLAAVMNDLGVVAIRASIDGFHRPRAERYARGRRSPEGFYLDSYDYATFRRVLIDPFREGGLTGATTGFQVVAFDLERDIPVEAEWTTAPQDAVLVVDGIFLHRPELIDVWDWSFWLDAPATVRFARMAERDGTDPDPDAASNERYRVGQEMYIARVDPAALAAVRIDNSDPTNPKVIR